MSKASKIGIVVAVAVVAILAAGMWFGKPVYRQYKETRSLKQARAFVEKGDYRNAVLSLRVALALNPSNGSAARLMADLFDQGQSPAALAWRKRVAELEPNLNNKIMLAACALRYEPPPFPTAAQVIESIRPSGETNSTFHLVASQLALKLNRLAEAETHLEAAAHIEPTNSHHQLNLATVRLQSKDTNVAAGARMRLTALADDPVLGLTALRSLTADHLTRRDFAGAEHYSQQLQAHPKATLQDRLSYLTALKEGSSPQLDQSLARVKEDSATNFVMLAQVIGWMNTHKLARPALEWVASLPAPDREALPVSLAEADCYMSLSDWSGLQERLMGHRWKDQEFLRLALLARALREQGERENAWRSWRQAINAASARPEFTRTLLQLASTWRWTEETQELLWTAHKRAPSEEWPLKVLMQDYFNRNDSEGLYRVYQALLERHAHSLEFKNNVAALGLLLGRDVARSTELAREVYEAGRTNATFVSTHAFALHTQGKSAEGLELLRAFPEMELQRPEIALYYGVLLAAAGEPAKSEPYLLAAEKRRALAEERLLLDRAWQVVKQ